MSQKSRRELLEEMLAGDPKDSFLRYGLAMEYAREGDSEQAVERLRALLRDEPTYVPAYFQAAQILLHDGDSRTAAQLLRDGIATARKQSDAHAAEEMTALLEQIE